MVTSGMSASATVNTLTVPSLQRHHLHQSFACNAANSELAVPITAAVTVDMTCKILQDTTPSPFSYTLKP